MTAHSMTRGTDRNMTPVTDRMLSSAAAADLLREFNRCGTDLLATRYAQAVAGGVTNTITSEAKGIRIQSNAPSGEFLRSLVLTLRMLVQEQHEEFAIEHLVPYVYNEFGNRMEASVRDRARQIVKDLDDYLDGTSEDGVLVEHEGRIITPREIFKVFMYGILAHRSKDIRDTARRWAREPNLVLAFHDCIATYLDIVRALVEINEEALKELTV